MKEIVKIILTNLVVLILVTSWIIALFCLLNPCWTGFITENCDYDILYNPTVGAYSLEYLEQDNKGYSGVQRKVHRMYYDIDPNRHFVVVEYPSLMNVGRFLYSSTDKAIVWVPDDFSGNVGQKVVYDANTNELMDSDITVISNGVKWLSGFWLGLWILILIIIVFEGIKTFLIG